MLINKLISCVEQLKLNLKGKTVLTEAANGAYVVTPVLAALAGANVFAFAKDSSYGTAKSVFTATESLIKQYNLSPLNITLIDKLNPLIIEKADIITNSGHLRPLDEEKLKYAKDQVVIPLMFEAWEWREADMDLAYIRKRGIKVGATNERHPDIDVFNYLGDMALKLIFDAGITPYRNRFILFCNNDFGPFIAKVLSKNCSGLGVIDKNENRSKYNESEIEWLGDFPNFEIPDTFRNAEAVIFTAYPFNTDWTSQESNINWKKLLTTLNNPYILRYAGHIDENSLNNFICRYYPLKVKSGHMGILPSAIGHDPIIRLQAGGLKAAELMIEGKKIYNNQKLVELI